MALKGKYGYGRKEGRYVMSGKPRATRQQEATVLVPCGAHDYGAGIAELLSNASIPAPPLRGFVCRPVSTR